MKQILRCFEYVDKTIYVCTIFDIFQSLLRYTRVRYLAIHFLSLSLPNEVKGASVSTLV